MKKSILFLIVIYLLSVASVNLFSQTATPPAAGDGTTGNPYQIQTLDNLYWLSQNSNEWDKHYIQTANIDASVTSGWDGGAGFSPIGNFSIIFTGTFKGYVYTISNLFINRPGTNYVGLFGYTHYASIENVGLTDVNITGQDYTGGLIGAADYSATISNTYTTGSVTGNNKVGGLAGYTSSSSSIINCYSVVNVTGNNYIGGLAGDLTIVSDIFNSYSAGSVSGTGADVGGLIGRNLDATVTNSFWDTETSGQATSADGIGKTTAEMKNSGTYGAAGWDLTYCWIRADVVNDGYPFLLAPFLPTSEAPTVGDGSSDDPYNIETLNNLVWLSQNSDKWNKHYIQVADIDAGASFTGGWHNGYGFSPIGTNHTLFAGSYNGKNHSISNLYINRPVTNFVGLFGGTLSCIIENLGAENVNITGKEHVGGLVGGSDIILNCSSSGSVKGRARIGGLSGDAGQIANSYSTASVEGGSEVGGLAGLSGPIINCYSTGSVSGVGGLGGLVGTANSSVINSFWDTETSGMATSAGGTGKTTAEMKTQSTFTNAGWDFTYCWNMDGSTNNSYPFLLEPVIPSSIAPSTGDGTSQNPWVIQSLGNLIWLSQNSSQWNKHFIQTADIDASLSFSEGWYNGYGFSPIGGYFQISFNGTYNGNNHTIANLYINRPANYIGLFGNISGTIKNLVIENADITGIGCVGGISGQANGTLIMNCSSTGSIGGDGSIGGLTGALAYGTIILNCNSSANVAGNSNIGGLVGYNYTSTISKSYASGNVEGNTNIGGLTGINYEANIDNSYSTSTVTGITENTGGLVGYNFTGDYPLSPSVINNSYSTGSVTGSSNTGGLVGNSNSFVTNSFWDTESSGQASSAGGTGITTVEMKNVVTYTDTNTVGLDNSWDFKGNPYNDTANENIWNIIGVVNNGYPCLRWELNEISTQPADQTVCSGADVILTVLAEGINITYQWKKDDVNIAGETSDTLALDSAGTEDDGLYACIITSDYDTLTSESADLTVLAATLITTQPVSQNVYEGEDVWLTTTASGVNLMYHWIKDGTSYMSPCSCPTIYISGVSAEDEGQYTCVVTGDCGEETSQAAALSIATNEFITNNSLTNDWLVFPNPTEGLFTIKHPEGSVLLEKSQIIITDITGTVIAEKQWSGNLKSYVINDLDGQPEGIYFIKICTSRNVKVVKIMKE